MKLDRTFRFRGARDYLHSTSLFDDILRIRGTDVRHIDMKFHQRTNHQVSYMDDPPSSDVAVVAEWKDATGSLYVVERDELIHEREPYDETALAGPFKIEGRDIHIPALVEPFTRIEAIIAGFKRLLHTCRGTPAGTRYAFVRIRLQYCPGLAMDIRYTRDIGDFFQGDINEQGACIGQVFFGAWQ